MLSPALRDKIQYHEFRLLYEGKVLLQNNTTKQEMKNIIRKIRKEHIDRRSAGVVDGPNVLYDKMKKYAPGAAGLVAKKNKPSESAKHEKVAKRTPGKPRAIWMNYRKDNGNWFKEEIAKLEKEIYDNKVPPAESIGTWRSIEFELLFNNEKAHNEFVRLVRRNRLSKRVCIKHDGSVKTADDREAIQNKEVVVTYKTGEEKIVRDILSFLKGRAYVNTTCGTHVHFDFRHLNAKEVEVVGRRLAKCVPAMRMLLPKERRENIYCKQAVNAVENCGGHEERRAFINLQAYGKYQTLENRGHSGTLVADKILNWIKLNEVIMNSRIRFKNETINTPEELIVSYRLDDEDKELASYIRSRAEKFKNSKSISTIVDEGEEVKSNDIEVSADSVIVHHNITIMPPAPAQPEPMPIDPPAAPPDMI